ncbi:MAG TPA: phospholipase D-like domain-containing protein [Steroidobacteraceae bacterium]|nr:phospholipase D-like domain-containing protein [Steroidobacteraceae bacterium]
MAALLIGGPMLAGMLSGCAHVPSVPEPLAIDSPAQIQVRGARGALSRRATTAVLSRLTAQAPDASALQRHLAIEQTVSGSPLYTGNRVTVLRDGPETFAATFAAIHRAQHYLYLEYYIVEDVSFHGEQLADLLIARQQQGVQINLMYDGIGSLKTPAALFDRLRAAGIHVRPFNPITTSPFSINDRDHRKILIADGQTATIGGVNLSVDYESGSGGPSGGSGGSGGGSAPEGGGAATPPVAPARSAPQSGGAATLPLAPAAKPAHEPWHDIDLEIDGPAVRELKQLFEQHWLRHGGSAAELFADEQALAARGDEVVRIIGSAHGELTPRYYATLISAIRSAATHIWATAAYFVPTLQEKRALALAARRGVDVRLLLPSHSDSPAALAAQHSHYADLLEAGVKIYERSDGILHSKTVVVDGVWSIVGSSNFDHRSVLFNDEVDAVVISAATGAQLERYFQQDLEHASAIDLATWKRRPLAYKLREHFWRLWEQLL